MADTNTYNPYQEDIFDDFLNDGIASQSEVESGDDAFVIEQGGERYFEAEGDEEYYDAGGDQQVADDDNEEVYDGSEDENPDDYILDIDFSQFKGDFKTSLRRVNRTAKKGKVRRKTGNVAIKTVRRGVPVGNQPILRKKNPALSRPMQVRPKTRKPLTKKVGVGMVDDSGRLVGGRAKLVGKGKNSKTLQRVLVPRDQTVIVQGLDDMILKGDKCSLNVKNVGYYKGKKLKELIFTMNNNSALDFVVELFNPSMPLDYLYSTSGNLNNKIQVAGGLVSYSDVMFNILGNPMHIPNAKFTFAGATLQQQINQPLIFKNKNSEGKQKIDPIQLQLQVDNMQVANDIVFFNIDCNLNRPFIPNGMDVLEYKVLAGNTVTFAFFYEQRDLRKLFFNEARTSKKLL